MGRRRYTPPFELEITHLGPKGVGVGQGPDGTPVEVKPAPPGGRILFAPQRKHRGRWQGRRVSLVRPPEAYQEPPCEVFGLCGGCVLQELSLDAQRAAKWEYALREVAEPLSLTVEGLRQAVEVHPIRGRDAAFHYRNKVELSFGNKQMLTQEAFDAREPIGGRFLGFHAAGRYDRIADVSRCWLISEAANALLTRVREMALAEGQPEPWDNREHKGFWRHLMLREGSATGQLLLALYTAPAQDEAEAQAVEALAEALMALPLPNEVKLVGVLWYENDGVADVTQGALRQTWGEGQFDERLGITQFRIAPETFFQTSTSGAVLLYDTIAEALGDRGGALFDLYCGIGSIGLYLAGQFTHLIGVDEVEASVQRARENAMRNGVGKAAYHAAKMEDALSVLDEAEGERCFVVDPPRAGLHPKVVRTLAQTPGDALVYVACHPASLGRDAAILQLGRWRLQTLWTIDLFPQTGHVEMVGLFLPTEGG